MPTLHINTTNSKTKSVLNLFNFFFLLILLQIVTAQQATQLVKLPPRTPPFQVQFFFPDVPIEYKQYIATISHDIDVAALAKQLVELVFRRPNPSVEKQVIARIMEKVQVYNSENRSYDVTSHQQRPVFSLNISIPSSASHPNPNIDINLATNAIRQLHFFQNDSPQFALKRFHHQQEIFNDDDLYTREALIASLHQKRLMHTKKQCVASNDFNQCLINHCIMHKPKFPGYEVQEQSSIKNAIVVAAAYRYRVQDCVETGTYKGDTSLLLAKEVCNTVHTIELSSKFANNAIKRFKSIIANGTEIDSNNAQKIVLHEGDSGDVLNNNPVFQSLRRTMWFLDGHYSYLDTARGQDDSPVVRELEFILNRKDFEKDIILIDDAREFRGKRFPAERTLLAYPHDIVTMIIDEMDVDGGVMVYPELDDIIDTVCSLAPEALIDLVDDVLIIRHLQSSTIV